MAFVALVPVLWAILSSRRRHAFFISLGFGLAWWLLALWWIMYATVPGYLGACVVMCLYWVLFGVGAHWLHARYPRGWIVLAPLLWTALELLRVSCGNLSFPMYLLGHTQWTFTPLIQIADVTGAYGISFLVAYANTVVTAFLLAYGKGTDSKPSKRVCWMHAVVVAGAILALLAYGGYRQRTLVLEKGPVLASVQANIPQYVKESGQNIEDVVQAHIALTIEEAERSKDTIDLYVWPETMLPLFLSCPYAAAWRSLLLTELMPAIRAPLLLGSLFAADVQLPTEDRPPSQRGYNSAFLIDPDGEIAGRYDKMRPVLFSEYIPFKHALPFLRNVVPPGFGYVWRNDIQTLFPLGDRRFAVVICYEDLMPDLARRAKRSGADFLVNLTNDAWFHESGELSVHLSAALFRAVENRLPLFPECQHGHHGIDRSARTSQRTRRAQSGNICRRDIALPDKKLVYPSGRSSAGIDLLRCFSYDPI